MEIYFTGTRSVNILIIRFYFLDFNEQRKIAKVIGATPEQILQNIADISEMISIF